jgi:hypothetical protein
VDFSLQSNSVRNHNTPQHDSSSKFHESYYKIVVLEGGLGASQHPPYGSASKDSDFSQPSPNRG